jgi:hypothetical protein
MKDKFQRILGIGCIALMAFLASCAANPKKKCDTCPKWTSEISSETENFTAKA